MSKHFYLTNKNLQKSYFMTSTLLNYKTDTHLGGKKEGKVYEVYKMLIRYAM